MIIGGCAEDVKIVKIFGQRMLKTLLIFLYILTKEVRKHEF